MRLLLSSSLLIKLMYFIAHAAFVRIKLMVMIIIIITLLGRIAARSGWMRAIPTRLDVPRSVCWSRR